MFPPRVRSHWPLFAVGALTLVAFALRVYRAGDSLGGFHAFNEGFYLAQAQGYVERGLASALLAPGDQNNPPLFSVMVAIAFQVFEPSVVAARAVSAAFSALGTVFVYGLTTELYEKKAGVMAALAFTLMPGSVLLGHNVQVDATMVTFSTGAVFLFVRAVRMSSTATAAAAGALLGVGVLTKITAVLALPALAVWVAYSERGRIGPAVRRGVAALVAFVAVAAPWYVLRMISSADEFLASQRGLAGTIDPPDLTFLTTYFLIESMWMVSPVLFALFLVFLASSVSRRGKGDLLVWLLLFVNVAFYLVYHYHTYYLLTLTPVVAVLTGRTLVDLGVHSWKRVLVVGVPMAAVLLTLSFATMAALKYGDSGLDRLDEVLDVTAPDAAVLATSDLLDNTGPALVFVSRREIGRLELSSPGGLVDTRPDAVVVDYWDDWGLQMNRPQLKLPRTGVRAVLFGTAFYARADWTHGFTLNSLEVESIKGPFAFGIEEYEAPAAYVIWLPAP
ncbi:MAG: glycosyltransferase family 39 protein [Actinobacteria bacterium]|nr:glycosyltransferase family 39 protein [Actinomycetota bacterium]